jgi:hypothetical protein
MKEKTLQLVSQIKGAIGNCSEQSSVSTNCTAQEIAECWQTAQNWALSRNSKKDQLPSQAKDPQMTQLKLYTIIDYSPKKAFRWHRACEKSSRLWLVMRECK